MGISSSAFDAAVVATAADVLTVDPGANSSGNNGFAGIYTGSGGDITIVDGAGNIVKLTGTAAGIVLPIRFMRLRSTGTVATSVLGLIAK